MNQIKKVADGRAGTTLVGKSRQVWVRGMYKLRRDEQWHMGERCWQREQLVQRLEQGCFSDGMRQQGCSKRWREVVAGGRVKEAEGPKGGKNLRLPPE